MFDWGGALYELRNGREGNQAFGTRGVLENELLTRISFVKIRNRRILEVRAASWREKRNKFERIWNWNFKVSKEAS